MVQGSGSVFGTVINAENYSYDKNPKGSLKKSKDSPDGQQVYPLLTGGTASAVRDKRKKCAPDTGSCNRTLFCFHFVVIIGTSVRHTLLMFEDSLLWRTLREFLQSINHRF
eukprot:scaffold1469_cov119-Cylindrotheca_fusiformis.AAC.16